MLDDLPAIPLPAFRQPHHDQLDELPESSPTTSPSDEPSSPEPPQPSPPDDGPAAPPPLSPEPPAARRTRTSGTSDPAAAGRTLAGLLVILAGITAGLLARSGRHLRQPTRRQVADVADPIGRIAARHLPTDLLGDDVGDVAEAAAAVHAYVLDEDAGPLITRIPAATVAYPEES
ncbi:hypothetical protein C5N14_30870 [Micromonospora sp. MW-13]|uniref:hypothetical protein n=1 Tax=Micromonospora sp. MW-13 TaxID=2094022 RepID=UPI000E436178|nr:hypothetical protein [Micromonospora sp. MW-13]RGC64996.1 hypothetical protein C5N14_30870 [Micromonospora sp. MW-13]